MANASLTEPQIPFLRITQRLIYQSVANATQKWKVKKVRLLYYINFDRLITKIQVNQDQRHIASFIQHLDYLICSLSCPSEAGSYDRVDVMKQIYHVGIWANHYKEKLEHQLLKNMTAHTIAPRSAFTAIWDTSLFWIWSKCFISSFFLRDRLGHI